jgi:TatD DNase family protein
LGLDFRKPYAGTEQRVRQEAAFRAQVQGARKHRLPAVLHVVRAHSQVLDLLREEGPLPGSGIVHSFSGGPREAQAYAELGLYLSVSGGTFRAGTEPFARVARAVPRDRWLVETDAPDQCHASWPGPWSKPAQVVEVAAFLAASLGDGATPEQVLDHSAAQIRRLFPV